MLRTTKLNDLTEKKKICLIYTGGTIGMKMGPKGYQPCPGYLTKKLDNLLKSNSMPEFTVKEYKPLLDSSNMTPRDWQKIANDIYEAYDEVDGFVVLHGTDTMAYTASALSFLLQNLRKPVVVTGAMIPICEIRSDARENLITSVQIAASSRIPEVSLFFHNKLMRGNRSCKVSSQDLEAFSSPNYPPLAEVGVGITLFDNRIIEPMDKQLILHKMDYTPQIFCMKLCPGITSQFLSGICKPPLQALILETYGSGNAPSGGLMMQALRQACASGLVIINISQCLKGEVEMLTYEAGSELLECGVISGRDITCESAYAKLTYLFGMGYSPEEVKRLFQKNLCGEMTSVTKDETYYKNTKMITKATSLRQVNDLT